MAVTGKCFLDFAKSACSDDTEISYRNAASRAYYAMYHAVLEQLVGPIPQYFNTGSHEKLTVYLEHIKDSAGENMDVKLKIQIAHMLKFQKQIRCTADYNLGEDFHEKDASMAIRQAEKLLSYLSKPATV